MGTCDWSSVNPLHNNDSKMTIYIAPPLPLQRTMHWVCFLKASTEEFFHHSRRFPSMSYSRPAVEKKQDTGTHAHAETDRQTGRQTDRQTKVSCMYVLFRLSNQNSTEAPVSSPWSSKAWVSSCPMTTPILPKLRALGGKKYTNIKQDIMLECPIVPE